VKEGTINCSSFASRSLQVGLTILRWLNTLTI